MASITVNPKLGSYDAICDYARERSEALDKLRWRLGDCANLVSKRWREKTIEDFARDIGQHKKTIYGYARVSRFYPQNLRRRLFEYKNINYSHMRDAMRLGDKRVAVQWLIKVSNEGWTADEASRELTKKIGHPTNDSIEGTIAEIYGDALLVNLSDIRLTVDTALKVGQVVVLRIKA